MFCFVAPGMWGCSTPTRHPTLALEVKALTTGPPGSSEFTLPSFPTIPISLKALLQSVGTSFGGLIIGQEKAPTLEYKGKLLKYEIFRHYFVSLVLSL